MDELGSKLLAKIMKAQMRLSRLLVAKAVEKTFGIKLRRKRHRHRVLHVRLKRG